MDGHAYHDAGLAGYTAAQRASLRRVAALNTLLVWAGETGRDLSGVVARLDPDPARYLWVDEGGGRLDQHIEDAARLLAAAPRLHGHTRVPTRRIGGHDASRPALATSPDGLLCAAWIRWRPREGEEIVAALYGSDGQQVAAPAPLSGAVADCFRPRALFDAAGRAWVFYARSEGGLAGTVAVHARCHEDGTWGPEQRVSTTGHPSFNQEVVAHADGTIECVWQGRSGRGFGLHTRRWRDGRWGAPRRLDAGVPGTPWDPSIAALPDGTTAYVWSVYSAGTYQVVVRRGDASDLGEARAITTGSDYALHPSLAAAGDGTLWCAFDLLTIQGHGGSGPTALQPDGDVERLSRGGTRTGSDHVPPELRPDVTGSVRVVRVDEDGVQEDPQRLGEGLRVHPCGMPQLSVTAGGGLTVAYRVLRRLPLLLYYWEVAVQQIGPDGVGPVSTLAASDASMEEPALAATPGGAVVATTSDGRLARALEWTEGFGGRRCAQLTAHIGEVAWHGVHGDGEIRLGSLPAVGPPRAGRRVPVVASSRRRETRAWVGARSERHTTQVAGETYTVYWGDLHRHTLLSRCTAGDESGLGDTYRYAWDVCDYDFWAVTDHSENTTEHQWWTTKKVADLFHAPGGFVPLYGFEWTSESGHQNVIYGDVGRDAPIFSSTDDGTDRPDTLWSSLRRFPSHPAITIPHHPGAGMVSYDWSYSDPEYLRVVEVFQACRGNYEDDGAFRQYADATATGTFVADGLRRGHRFGLIASTDHGYGASYVGAYAEDLTREAVFDALRQRRTIAATARGIVLDVRAGETFLGGEIRTRGPVELDVLACGFRELARIEVVRNGEVIHRTEPDLELPAGWVAVPVRVEWGRSTTVRDWSGMLSISGGEILQTPWWSPEIRDVRPRSIGWSAETSAFGGGGIYEPTRGGVEATLLGPPGARVTLKTLAGGIETTLERLRRGAVDATGPQAPEDGVLRLQPGTGGLTGLGTSRHRLRFSDDPGPGAAWYYVRAIQVDGEMAWSSPIWVDRP